MNHQDDFSKDNKEGQELPKLTKEQKEKYLPEFLVIPGVVFFDEELQPLDIKVYAILYWLSRLNLKKAIPSNRFLALILNSHEISISRSLANLEQRGHIKRIFDEVKGRTEIKLTFKFSKIEEDKPNGLGGLTNSLRGVNQMVKGGKPNGLQISKIYKEDLLVKVKNKYANQNVKGITCLLCKRTVPPLNSTESTPGTYYCLDCYSKLIKLRKKLNSKKQTKEVYSLKNREETLKKALEYKEKTGGEIVKNNEKSEINVEIAKEERRAKKKKRNF